MAMVGKVNCNLENKIQLTSFQINHLMNHAFLKALLFLSASLVIHAMSNEQDMRKMEGGGGGPCLLIPFYVCHDAHGQLSITSSISMFSF